MSYLDLYEVKTYIKQKSFIESFFWGWHLWGLPLYLYICLACIASMSCQCKTYNELYSTSFSPSFSWLFFLLCFIQLFYLIEGEIILVSWLFPCPTWFYFIWLGRDLNLLKLLITIAQCYNLRSFDDVHKCHLKYNHLLSGSMSKFQPTVLCVLTCLSPDHLFQLLWFKVSNGSA